VTLEEASIEAGSRNWVFSYSNTHPEVFAAHVTMTKRVRVGEQCSSERTVTISPLHLDLFTGRAATRAEALQITDGSRYGACDCLPGTKHDSNQTREDLKAEASAWVHACPGIAHANR